jgi:hypothetical protein
MEPEPGEGLDAFLRRAAQVAALGAAVGAAVGAARAARAESGEDDERDSSERGEPSDQRAQLQEQEEATAESEPERPEQDENEEEEPEQHYRQIAQEQAAPDEQPEEDESGPEQPRGESRDGQITGEVASVIRRALPQVEQLTGREPEGVLGLRRDDEGWLVTVEVVELPRVPSSTDVLSTYDVVLNGDGDVREYRRTGRYIRGRADPGE